MKNSSSMKKIFCFAILFVSVNASAAGFDCTKASTTTEHMICENKVLSELDSVMSNLYQNKKDNELKQIQQNWIKTKRANATTVDELNKLYEDHILFLSGYKIKTERYIAETKENSQKLKVKKTNESGRLQLSDFENEFIMYNGIEYSTKNRDMDRQNYVLVCTESMMVDLMSIWRKDSVKKNQSREFNRLRNNLYNGLWNMTVDNIDSQINTQRMRDTCKLLISGNR